MNNPTQLIEQLVAALKTLAEHGAYSMSVAEPALTAARAHLEQPTEPVPSTAVERDWPDTMELEELWFGTHFGHPADFAADVLERWGGAPSGLMGYGGRIDVSACKSAALLQSTALPDHSEQHLDMVAALPVGEPLTDAQISALYDWSGETPHIYFARAIEAAHGIKGVESSVG